MVIFLFDAILAVAAGAAVPPAAARPAPWTAVERVTPQGGKSISASIIAHDNASRLIVKCDRVGEPIVSIQFIRPDPIGQSEDKPVAMRFDGGPAATYNWEFPGAGAFVRDPAAVAALTVFMARANEIGVETTNAAGFAVNATFDGPHGDAAIRTVLAACGYGFGVVPLPSAPPRDKQ